MTTIYFKPRPQGVNPSCVVLTYSVTNTLEAAIEILKKNGASVHYIIDKDGSLKQLSLKQGAGVLAYVNYSASDQVLLEQQQTFYADETSSMWRGREHVNKFGIGIMYINDAKSFITNEQMKITIDLLKKIRIRNYPEMDFNRNLVSLSEVVPKHVALKNLLNYEKLYRYGFGPFLETTPEEQKEILISKDSPKEDIMDLQRELQAWGCNIEINGKWDWDASDPEAHDPIKKYQSTAYWVTKFNHHYVPNLTTPDPADLPQPAVAWTDADQICLADILYQV